jgi:hypothetical protein
MSRASRNVYLALIGSIACLYGFLVYGSRRWTVPSSQPSGGGYHYWSRGYGGYGGYGGGGSSVGASARGGFGAHGTASGG